MVEKFNGKLLRDMNREDLLEALQHYSALYTEARDECFKHLARNNQADRHVFG